MLAVIRAEAGLRIAPAPILQVRAADGNAFRERRRKMRHVPVEISHRRHDRHAGQSGVFQPALKQRGVAPLFVFGLAEPRDRRGEAEVDNHAGRFEMRQFFVNRKFDGAKNRVEFSIRLIFEGHVNKEHVALVVLQNFRHAKAMQFGRFCLKRSRIV